MSVKVNCDAYDGCSFEGGDEDIICSRVDALQTKLDKIAEAVKRLQKQLNYSADFRIIKISKISGLVDEIFVELYYG